MTEDLTSLTQIAIDTFRQRAAEFSKHPEMAQELTDIADALQHANEDRIAAEAMLAELEEQQ